jgi:hypothetical protein
VVFLTEPPRNGDGSHAAVRGADAFRRGLPGVIAAVALVMLFGAERADALVPSVTFKCTPAPQDCSGWYRSNVSIDWIVIPSDAAIVAGCRDKTLTTDTAGTNEFCSADDGSATVTVQLRMKVDKTPPVVLGGQPGRGADFGGWYNHPVAVAFSGTDQTSGVDACTTLTYAGPDSGAGSLTGTCIDKAGNVGSLGYGLKYDATSPSVTGANPEHAPNAAGWFNRPVAFTLGGSDATSGIEGCTTLTYAGPETATGSFSGSCRDRAGNSAGRSFPIKYDATAPVTTGGQPARGPDRNGWYNRSVAVGFSGTDQLSGVQGCTSTTYTGPDGGAVSVPGTCTDRAGNVGNLVSVPLKYDDTAPLVAAATPARGADVNGWYNRPVAVAFSGSDSTSGVDVCTAATYSGPDTASASLSGTCTDMAGNVSSSLGYGLSYDATAPEVISASAERAPDVNGWYNHPVTFAIAGDDATAGIQACPDVTYAGPDGAVSSLVGLCSDRAGNVSTRAFGLRFDATAPAIMNLTATAADRRVALSWRTSADTESVAVTRTPGVGLEKTTLVFGGPGTSFVDARVENGVWYAYEVRVRDPAGNLGSETVSAVPAAPLAPLAPLGVGAPVAPDVHRVPAGPPLPVVVRGRAGHLVAPAAGAVIRARRRPLLRWTPVPGASYYNVQLFRGGKILTAWTSQPQHRLKLRWRYRGRRYRLGPGEYHWIVWPGYGPRSKADYGRRIGRRSFEVRAPSR